MLITNGCSFVWGDELNGYNKSPPTHWGHTFTHKLGQLLNLPYENLAKCGNGNDKIFRDTIVRLCDPTLPRPTHMVILWSAWQREEYAHRLDRGKYSKLRLEVSDCMIQYSVERTAYCDEKHFGAITKYYNEFYNVRTSIIHHLAKMLAMQKLCDEMGIKLIQGAFHERMMSSLSMALTPRKNDPDDEWKPYRDKIEQMLSLLKDTSRVGLGKWTDMFSLCRDTEEFEIKPASHPCEKTHHEYAKLLHHIFTNVTE